MSGDFLPVRALSKADDVFGFCSGNPGNDSWLRNRAAHAMGAKTACVYVVPSKNDDLCGFYSLSAHSVERTGELNGRMRRNMTSSVPCTLLGQLAVDKRYQGQSVGARLLQDAIRRAAAASKVVASRALIVDPADENASGFYVHFGFRPLGAGARLFLPLP